MMNELSARAARLAGAAGIALALGAAHAAAAVVTIDFDTLPGGAVVANGTAITDQYASLGVVFSVLEEDVVQVGPIATISFAPPDQVGNRLGNFFNWTGGDGERADILRIEFSSEVSAVSFDFFPQGTSGADTRVVALDGALATISDATTGIDGFPVIGNYVVAGSGIRRIDIYQPSDDWNWGLDNLTFTTGAVSDVPAPASALLFGLGLAAIGATRRRQSA